MPRTCNQRAIKRWDILARLLPHDKPIRFAEIGVWRGKMASFLFARLPLMNWVGVDTWAPPPAGSSYASSGADISQKDKSEFVSAFLQVTALVSKHSARAKVIRMDSVEAASQFGDVVFDCVFIDGDHSYEGCKRDILAWLPKVRKGGIISGHDYANKKGEVKKAVDEIIGKVNLEQDHVWWKAV